MNNKLQGIQNWPQLAHQANWSVAELAKQCEVSKDSLRRHFFKLFGKPPGDWLAEERNYQALELLRDGFSIKKTSTFLGYKHQRNFSRKFKMYWGICPTFHATVQPSSAKRRGND
jgi:AraC-like DNA-binding protein